MYPGKGAAVVGGGDTQYGLGRQGRLLGEEAEMLEHLWRKKGLSHATAGAGLHTAPVHDRDASGAPARIVLARDVRAPGRALGHRGALEWSVQGRNGGAGVARVARHLVCEH